MSDSDYSRIDLSGIQIQLRREQVQRMIARQVDAQESFVEACEESVNPWAADKNKRDKFKTLEQRTEAGRMTEVKKNALDASDEAMDLAKQYEQRNPELNARSLNALFKSLNPSDPAGNILQKVLAFFPDPFLADEAMEYLAAIAAGELQAAIRKAKEELNEKHKRRIVAGRNIAGQARQFAEKGLGTPTSLRDLYRDVTHNPREPLTLFEEFAEKYPFEKLSSVLQFMFHSLGSDLNSKGPSIDPGELYQLLNEVRTLQAILGVYRFFKGRMNLLTKYFSKNHLNYPDALTFELLAKSFVKLAMDRYPNSVKVLQLAQQFKVQQEPSAQIIILMQLRDAIRGLSPRIYKTDKHRQELLDAIIDALSELEDLIEEEEDEEENDGKNPKKFQEPD